MWESYEVPVLDVFFESMSVMMYSFCYCSTVMFSKLAASRLCFMFVKCLFVLSIKAGSGACCLKKVRFVVVGIVGVFLALSAMDMVVVNPWTMHRLIHADSMSFLACPFYMLWQRGIPPDRLEMSFFQL
jgi:hypothetical protein